MHSFPAHVNKPHTISCRDFFDPQSLRQNDLIATDFKLPVILFSPFRPKSRLEHVTLLIALIIPIISHKK